MALDLAKLDHLVNLLDLVDLGKLKLALDSQVLRDQDHLRSVSSLDLPLANPEASLRANTDNRRRSLDFLVPLDLDRQVPMLVLRVLLVLDLDNRDQALVKVNKDPSDNKEVFLLKDHNPNALKPKPIETLIS